jgi:D-glycero-alpha-D-manno-heptose-7-phosphate kinase
LSLSKSELAEFASYVEIEKLAMPIGRQDQYAAAFGGLNAITFAPTGVQVEPLGLPPSLEQTLERRIMLFFTRASRSAASILKDQEAASHQDGEVVASLHQIKALAHETIELFRAGDLDGFGALLHESWQAKKRLAKGITNARIDASYDLARTHGALGGKIAGAGGGGFLLLYCREETQEAVTAALEAEGLVRMDFHFERGGAVVLMDAVPRIRNFGAPRRALAALKPSAVVSRR